MVSLVEQTILSLPLLDVGIISERGTDTFAILGVFVFSSRMVSFFWLLVDKSVSGCFLHYEIQHYFNFRCLYRATAGLLRSGQDLVLE